MDNIFSGKKTGVNTNNTYHFSLHYLSDWAKVMTEILTLNKDKDNLYLNNERKSLHVSIILRRSKRVVIMTPVHALRVSVACESRE